MGTVAVVAATGLAFLSGCASSQSPQTQNAPGSTTNGSTPLAGQDQASPSFLAASTLPAPSQNLPMLASAPAGTASLPWLQVTRAQGSGKLTVEVVFGVCTSAPEGYATSETSSGLVLTVVAEIHHAAVCTADLGHGLYELVLPASDAHKVLLHGAVHDWQYGG